MGETRYIGRANVAKRLRALDGSEGRTLYRDGSVRIELDEGAVTVTPPFGLEHAGEYDVVRAGPSARRARGRAHRGRGARHGSAASRSASSRASASSTSKVGTRFVKGRHKKGGSSSNRFRRRRGEQERELVDAAATEAARVLGPWRDRVEHVALGGDRAAVGRVLDSRPDLAWLEAARAGTVLRRPRSAPARARGAAVPALRRKSGRGDPASRSGGRRSRRRPSRSRGSRRADDGRARRGRRCARRRCRGRG